MTTFWPSTSDIAVMQERTAWPPTCTVQAPQSATPQPNFVPVSPSLVTQIPEKRQRRIAVVGLARAIHVDGDHAGLPFWFVTGLRCGLF